MSCFLWRRSLLAFSISSRQKRIETIRSGFRDGDAQLLNLYRLSAYWGEKAPEEMRKLIDVYLISQLDIPRLDYFDKTRSMADFVKYVKGLKIRTKGQSAAYDQLLESIQALRAHNRSVLWSIREKMMGFEWFSLIPLSGIVWICLFFLNDHSVFSILVIPFLSLTFLLMLLILREFNSLRWQEQHWIWKPLEELFGELDLMPYFPDELFRSGCVHKEDIAHLKAYRLATYFTSYPDLSGKKVKVVKN